MNHSSEHVQLSQSQMGIYAECMQHPGEKVYDQPFIFKFSRKVNLTALQAAIQKALEAHPNMYCRVAVNDEGTPVQYIDTSTPIEVPILEVEDIESVKSKLWEPMYLDGRLLTRLCLIRTPDANYMFMQIHHLIFDGTTLSVFFHDIENAYQGGHEFTREDLAAIDFARQETIDRQSDRWAADRRWYEEHILDTEVETTLLPDLEETETRYARLYLPMKADVGVITSFCKQHGVRVSNYMCSAFALLMSRYTGDEQVLFTTIWHGRRQMELAKTCGMFVSTVPLFYKLKAGDTVGDLLEQGRELGDGTREHGLFSLGDAISELGIRPQVMFAYQGYTLRDVIIGGEKATYERLFDHGTYNPIGLQLFLTDEGYELCVEYMANRYSEALVRALAESLDTVIGQLCDLEKPLSDISITSENQLQQLDAFNQNDMPYDDGQTIVSLFRQQAELHPDLPAVVYLDRRYTYREVDQLSDRLAAYLVGKGLKAEDVVSILIPRCEWMAIASLGVLKAGCAYQPLDPTYPAERLNFMVEDASARLLIADEELRPIVDKYQGDVLFTKDIPQLPEPSAPVEVEVRPENLFILLYTSGSTGVPKGCQLEHRNLVAFCNWYQRHFKLNADAHVAAYASYGFDACMMDLYPALTCGACVYIISEDIRLDLLALNEYFEANQITHSFMTTQVGYQFATNIENHSLRYFAVGGEKLPSLNPPQGYEMHNAYGPTECTIFTTTFWVNEHLRDIPIGKPLDNVHLYIVDKQGHRLPVGACGE
ncbi:MAG: AMP-binding protein, partial [Prevotella sp.]|nr:AMP-binding protein [Prevotella sp.]